MNKVNKLSLDMKQSVENTVGLQAKFGRNVGDNIFRTIFNNPAGCADLYYSVTGKQVSVDEIAVTTLAPDSAKDRRNDVSFIVGNRLMCFFEAQTTMCANMAIRMWIYASKVYQSYLQEAEFFDKYVYSSVPLLLPCPEFYVVYAPVTGRKRSPCSYSLANHFKRHDGEVPPLDLYVRVISADNAGAPSDNSVAGYIKILEKYGDFKRSMPSKDAWRASIDYCYDNKILPEYLTRLEMEDVAMELFEYDYNRAMEIAVEEAELRGDVRGEARGAILKAVEVVRTMIREGFARDAAISLVATDAAEAQVILKHLDS